MNHKITTETPKANHSSDVVLDTKQLDQKQKVPDSRQANLDSGYAWVILVVMFLLNSTISGSSRVYGLVYAKQVAIGYYDRQDASWPIATASTIENLFGILTPALATKFSWRQIELLCAFLFVCANLGAYYSDSLLVDIICLGFIQGLALSFSTVLSLAINNEYFERYRTTAYGISMSGSTFGVLYLVPIVSWLLESYDNFRLVYLALAVVFSCNIILVLFIKPRAKEPRIEPEIQQKPAVVERKVSRLEFHFERKASVASRSDLCLDQSQSSWQSQRRVSTLSQCLSGRKSIVAKDANSSQIASSDNQWNSKTANPTKAKISLPDLESQIGRQPEEQVTGDSFSAESVWKLLRLPYFHCVWIMLSLYYLISRVYIIILVDFADDHGLDFDDSRRLLNYWSLGEVLGRIFLGSFVDLQWLSIKSTITLTCSLLAFFASLMVAVENYYVYAASSLLIAALVSLEYMLINVLMIEYIGKEKVTSCYPYAALISSAILFARPTMIGFFRDQMGTYDGLLMLLAGITFMFAFLFVALEPMLVRRWPKPRQENQTR